MWFNEGEPLFVAVFRDDLDDRGLRKPLTYRVLVSQDGSGVPEDWLGIIAPVHIRYNEANYHDIILPTLANDGDEPDTTVTFTLLESPEYRIDPDKASVTVTVRDLDPAPVLEIADATAHGEAWTASTSRSPSPAAFRRAGTCRSTTAPRTARRRRGRTTPIPAAR